MAYINSKKILSVVQTKFLPAVYQSKTITPSNFQRVVTADNGYAALESVKIDGILVDPHTEIESVTDATTAYQKSVPAGALSYAGVNSLGGMSYKCENLLNIANVAETTTNGITYKVENGVITLNGTCNNDSTAIGIPITPYTTIANQTYQYSLFNNTANTSILGIRLTTAGTTRYEILGSSITAPNLTVTRTRDNSVVLDLLVIRCNTSTVFNNFIFKPMFVLGSTAPTEYQPYFDGIRDSAVTSLVGAETITIPAAIQALDGYGWGVNETCYNYIDFEAKKFVQKVARVDLGSLNYTKYEVTEGNLYRASLPSNSIYNTQNCLCAKYEVVTRTTRLNKKYYINNESGGATSTVGTLVDIVDNDYSTASDFKQAMAGVYLYYELATPVETDISQYIDTDIIEVAANGSLTFNNTYEQAVPSSITYLVEV